MNSVVTLNTCHQLKNTTTPFMLIPAENSSIFETLTQCASIMNLQSAFVSGIGSIKNIELGFYDHDKLLMDKKSCADIYEIASLSGSISYCENHPFIHLHGSFCDATYQAFGGHIIDAHAGAACELFITPLPAKITRIHDEKLGIKRIHC